MANKKTLTACLTMLAGAAAAPVAVVQAAPVTVDFTVTSSVMLGSDYPVNTIGSGFFTFDDALMPAGGNGVVGDIASGAPTLDLSFNWFGVSFDETIASIGTLTFSNGSLADWLIGGDYRPSSCGSNTYGCVSSLGTAPDFMVNSSTLSWLNDGIHYGLGSGYGTVDWSVRSAVPETPVPEPGMLLLSGLGLMGLSFVRRKRVA